jgi:hypothetical protein
MLTLSKPLHSGRFVYRCSLCGEYVSPHSDDGGKLICPHCELVGLLPMNELSDERLEQVREFARGRGLGDLFEDKLYWLSQPAWGNGAPRQCRLYVDHEPHSFYFEYFTPGAYTSDGKPERGINGGLIWCASRPGWGIHT